MGGNVKGAQPDDQKAGEDGARAKKTVSEETPTKIHELLAGIKAATEENGRTLKAIRVLLEKAEARAVRQDQGQQPAQTTARSRQEQDAGQRKGNEADADDANNEGDHDDAGAAQARTPRPYDTYRTERRAQPPGIIPLVNRDQGEQRSGSYPNPRASSRQKDQ
jgi:hypothetical protein